MEPRKTLAGLAVGTTLVMGGVDAATLDERPLERIETVAEERVVARQVGNVIETTFPWKDQEGIKVKLDLGEPTITERFNDKRKREVITETVTDFDGGFKVDILLNERPDTNVFCYDIEGADQYDFFYQPPLTEEEIAEGASRPENIEGSYAVYHKTLANHQLGKENYATGKVMHIPRPQVWELNNQASTTEWADLSYTDDEGLCVTVRQEFLDKAEYPVRVDPSFGYATIGASSAASGAPHAAFFTTSEYGEVTSISSYNSIPSGSVLGGRAIYSSVASLPSIILTEDTGDVTITTTPDWYTADISYSLVASTTYWLAQWNNSATTLYYYDAGATNQRSFTNAGSFQTWPSPWTNDGLSAREISIYATYTACYSSEECGPFTETFTATGTSTWTAPTGVTQAFVQCWGGGGGGAITSAIGGGGGGGGAYAAATTSVTAGVPYPVVVGGGGGIDTGLRAGTSTFGTTSVIAQGGLGATTGNGVAGGTTANSSGTIEYAGGTGGTANTTGDVSGGGGGSAGPNAAGGNGANGSSTAGVAGGGGGANNGASGNATSSVGGLGANGGGDGGVGDNNGSTAPDGGTGVAGANGGGGGGGGDDGDPGGPGGFPGGGGGGGEITGSQIGANGQCTITYTIPAAAEDSPPFTEDFEDADPIPGNFDIDGSADTGSFELDASSTVNGTYSARCETPANGDDCLLIETVTSSTTYYAQMSVFLPSDWSFGGTGYAPIFSFSDGTGLPVYCLYEDYGSVRITCAGDELGYIDTGINVPLNTKTQLEFRATIGNGTGTLQIWKDNNTEGAPDYSSTTLNTGSQPITSFRIGGANPDAIEDRWYDDMCVGYTFWGSTCFAVGGAVQDVMDVLWFD